MKKAFFPLVAAALSGCLILPKMLFAQAGNTGRISSVLDYVNPFIGTTNAVQPTKWGAEGGTYPGAVAPWGRMQLSPETKTNGLRGYDYRDSLLYFFSCTNHSSGYPNGSAGNMKVLPLAAPRLGKKYKAGRTFRHTDESAQPGYYKVQFTDDQAMVEMTSAAHTGMFRFRFPAGVLPRIYLGDMGKLIPRSKRQFFSERQNLLISFPADMMGLEAVEDGVILTFSQQPAENSLLMKLSISSVDESGSKRNMQMECPDWDFDKFLTTNQQKWKELLNLIQVDDPSVENKTKFYTALYHSFLVPWIISDVDGRYKGADGKIHTTSGTHQYGKFSPWDTYRSLHPLLTLLVPSVQQDMIRSMLDHYEQTGKLPKGPMTGYHSLPVILDSWRKGIRGFDAGLAWKAMQSSLEATRKEPDFEEYRQIGYVSSAYAESVTKTVEFAYNDWVMEQMALEMRDSSAMSYFKNKGFNYRNLFHSPSGFILPRKEEQFMLEPESIGYKEGDKWIYSYVIPHDARGLINLMGGDSSFIEKLDSALATGLLLFDNEPAFHVPYLFNFTSQPGLSQAWVREIMQQKFSADPGGLPGNDDLGSMSSWLVFSAMGFYPVAVGTPVYEIGSPLLKNIKLQLPGGKFFEVSAPLNTTDHVYVQGLTFKNKEYPQLFISHSDVLEGGKLEVELGLQPADEKFLSRRFNDRSATIVPIQPELMGYYIRTEEVHPHDSLWVIYTIRNAGAEGNAAVSLSVDGQPQQSKMSWLPEAATIVDSILLQAYQPGEHTIRLNNGHLINFQVKLPAEAPKRKFQILELETRPLARLGAMHRLVYSVQNISGQPQSIDIPVLLNGRTWKTENLLLAPGEIKRREMEVPAEQPGIMLLELGDRQATIKVAENPREKLVLDISMGNPQPDELIKDKSGLANHGIYRKETRLMADNTRQSIQYVQFQNAPALDDLEEEITIMAWVFPGKQNGLADILSKGDFIVLQQSGGTLSFFAGGWGQGSCDVPAPKDWENKWHHVAGVCKGKLFTLYIDGVAAGSFEVDNAVNLSSRLRWVLGGNEEFPDQRYFNGKINGFKVFTAALTDTEIAEEMVQ